MIMTNNNSYVHQDFVEEAIQELLASSRILEVYNKAQLRVINPLSVSVQTSGKKRLILDLGKVNQCLYKQKFKFEDHKHAWAISGQVIFSPSLVSKVDTTTLKYYLTTEST